MIRRARPDEAQIVTAIVNAAYGHYVERIGRAPAPMIDDYDLRIAAGQVWVLTESGHVVGILVIMKQDGDLLLDNVAIRPDRQGRGHGRRLIAFAEQMARDCGLEAIRLYTNVKMTENIALYSRLGFVEIGRDASSGWERVNMRKSLV